MKFVFWASDKEREHAIARALATYLTRIGWEFELRRTKDFSDPIGDVGACFGVKGASRQILDRYLMDTRHCLFFDKAHIRQSAGRYFRVSVDGYMPLAYFQRHCLADRWNEHNIRLKPERDGLFIIFAGSSQKHCDFHGLGDAHNYARLIIDRIREQTDRPIIYRPKPSDGAAKPIPGTEFSPKSMAIESELARADALVTHSSNAAVDAIINGVRAVVLGPGIARPVASSTIGQYVWPGDADRLQWLADLSYCQWTLDEIRNGAMWPWIDGLLG